jgi:hypothetical protein
MLVKNNDLVVATHGRGFWIMDDVTPLRQITPEVTTAAAHLFDITPVQRHLPVQVRRSAGMRAGRESETAGENPSGGAVIDYVLKQPAGAVTLSILDANGQVIQQFSSEAKDSNRLPAGAGANRFIWNLRYPGAREVARPAAFVSAEFSRAQAPIAPPGRYRVRLSAGGQQYEKPLDIRRDPRVTATDEDLKAHFDLMVRINNRVSEITALVDKVRAARQQSQKDAATSPDVGRTLQEIESVLTRLSGPNPNTFPPKALNDRLGALSGAVAQADARPTKQMYAVFEELSAGVSEQERRFNELAKRLSSSQQQQ